MSQYRGGRDQGQEWTKQRRADARNDPGKVDLDEKIAQTRKDLEEHLSDVIPDQGDLNRALEFLNSYASALTDPGEDEERADDPGAKRFEREGGPTSLDARLGMDSRGRLGRVLKGFRAPARAEQVR